MYMIRETGADKFVYIKDGKIRFTSTMDDAHRFTIPFEEVMKKYSSELVWLLNRNCLEIIPCAS